MERKQATFAIKGMNRDLANSKFNPEFAYENKNIRITPTDDNTLLVLTNEKGPSLIEYSERSITVDNVEYKESKTNVLGYAVIYKTIVLFEQVEFAAEGYDSITKDCISTLKKDDTETSGWKMELLYYGSLNFNFSNPIETLPLYESEDIQKVYWVDGLNQPRVINIKNNAATLQSRGDNQFDFLPKLDLSETFSVERDASQVGSFPGGTLQYCFNYSKKNGQETKIVNISKLLYSTFEGRAASPEEVAAAAYKITIDNADRANFDYINLYSILTTSEDATKIVKLVAKIDLADEPSSSGYIIIDTNLYGEEVEATKLFYLGGESFIAGTLEAKDNTLFLGELTYQKTPISSTLIEEIERDSSINEGIYTSISYWRKTNGFYTYNNPLLNQDITYLRAGNKYRLGIQLQDEKGDWSEPVFIQDFTPTKKPYINFTDNSLNLPKQQISCTSACLEEIFTSGYRRIRPVVVYPEPLERGIVAQGVVCPTVFNITDRTNNAPFAQPSWFFRPYNYYGYDGVYNLTSNTHPMSIENRHLHRLSPAGTYNGELLSQYETYLDSINGYSTKEDETKYNSSSNFFIDNSIITFHSPDVNDTLSDTDLSLAKIQLVGAFLIDSFSGRSSITAGTPNSSSLGKVSSTDINVSKRIETSSWKQNLFCTQTLWKDVPPNGSVADYYATYPWHRSTLGYNYESGTAHGDIQKKVLSNIRVSQTFAYFSGNTGDTKPDPITNIADSKIYRKENYNSYLGFSPSSLLNSSLMGYNTIYYKGAVTKVIAPSQVTYNIPFSSQLNSNLNVSSSASEYRSTDGIPIGYKSDDHIVFVLNNNSGRDTEIPTPFDDDKYQHDSEVDSSEISKRSIYSGHPYWENSSQNNTKIYYLKNFYVVAPTSVDTFISELGIGYSRDIITTNLNLYTYYADSSTSFTWTPKYISTDYNVFCFKGATSLVQVDYYLYQKVAPSQSGLTTTYQWVEQTGTADGTPIQILPVALRSLDTSSYSYKNREIMWIVDICRTIPESIFGGDTAYAKKSNKWLPCGKAEDIINTNGVYSCNIEITEGDTIFNRWDCLKTFPYSTEDINQVVEIMSFMCESYVNTAGRYDKNRGLEDYTFLNESTPFNQINNAYNTKNNLFSYRTVDIIDEDTSGYFPNQVTWSSSKTLGESTDSWTSITLSSVLDLDGDRGKIRALRNFNNSIYSFQDTGIAEILYNPSVAINTTNGVPIEIANSGKVEGKRYISGTVGCTNKWSICSTPNGLYFIDSIVKKVYRWSSEGLTAISDTGGMTSLFNNSLSVVEGYNPKTVNDTITQYDRTTGDIYFINRYDAVAYNEKLQCFTSFYDYGSVPYLINLDNDCIAIHSSRRTGISTNYMLFWKMHGGDYNLFFNTAETPSYSSYYTELVVNPNPTEDKIFTNIDFIADSYNGTSLAYIPDSTFNKLEVSNEYQSGSQVLTKGTTLKKRFRTWYANIPRNTASSTEAYQKDRMRNPWIHLKLSKNPASNEKTILHSLNVNYFV